MMKNIQMMHGNMHQNYYPQVVVVDVIVDVVDSRQVVDVDVSIPMDAYIDTPMVTVTTLEPTTTLQGRIASQPLPL